MKIQLLVQGSLIVADGAGIALTLFVGEDGIGRLSLASSKFGESGDCINTVWVDNQPVVLGETVLVDIVENVETTKPLFTKTESSKDRIEAQKQYCLKLLASESKLT